MTDSISLRLQLIVFALVASSFTNIYITQPVLPVLQQEFGADIVVVSFTVSAVILGITLSNLPFGLLADKLPIQPIIIVGGIMVTLGGVVCALTEDLWVLIGARFVQGLFIPAMTTCLAAYLAKTLPVARLNVVMGAYVSATVMGGLGGRLLGGWIHPPLHWRYAFITASVLMLIATFTALRWLPKKAVVPSKHEAPVSFSTLMRHWDHVRIYLCAAGSFFIFSSIFNYLPFRLSAAPFNYSTEMTTMVYLVYVVGIFMGPLAGRLSNRFGNGISLLLGSIFLGVALALMLLPTSEAVIMGLLLFCASFFAIHAAAVGSLNRRLSHGHGRANALYVLFYYLGGWLGITSSGFVFKHGGWDALIYLCACVVLIPLSVGLVEQKKARQSF
ncbi:MAG: MFS transporter [Gammaproteobacteria bacterium]